MFLVYLVQKLYYSTWKNMLKIENRGFHGNGGADPKNVCILVHHSIEVKNRQRFMKIYSFYFQTKMEGVWWLQRMIIPHFKVTTDLKCWSLDVMFVYTLSGHGKNTLPFHYLNLSPEWYMYDCVGVEIQSCNIITCLPHSIYNLNNLCMHYYFYIINKLVSNNLTFRNIVIF